MRKMWSDAIGYDSAGNSLKEGCFYRISYFDGIIEIASVNREIRVRYTIAV